MNKFGRVFIICIFVISITGAVEVPTKFQASSRVELSDRTRDQSKTTTSANSGPKQTSQLHAGKLNHVSAHAVINNGVVGVASIAGVDSRNGRYSSISGYKFYPPIDTSKVKTDKKGTFFFKSDGGKMPMPLTITKQGDGVSGTIRIQPGSVSVSSSAKAGSSSSASVMAGGEVPDFEPSWSVPYVPPMMTEIFFPPFPDFPTIPDPFEMHKSMSDSYPKIPEPSYPMIHESYFPKNPGPSFQKKPELWKEKSKYKHKYPRHSIYEPSWFYPSFSPYMNFWR